MGFSLTTSRILVTSTEIICIEANSLYFDIRAKSLFWFVLLFFNFCRKTGFEAVARNFGVSARKSNATAAAALNSASFYFNISSLSLFHSVFPSLLLSLSL